LISGWAEPTTVLKVFVFIILPLGLILVHFVTTKVVIFDGNMYVQSAITKARSIAIHDVVEAEYVANAEGNDSIVVKLNKEINSKFQIPLRNLKQQDKKYLYELLNPAGMPLLPIELTEKQKVVLAVIFAAYIIMGVISLFDGH
jgi:hypothetical protein